MTSTAIIETHTPPSKAPRASSEPPFSGRAAVLARLVASFERSLARGTSHLTEVIGPPRAGKTRLLRCFAEALEGHPDACPTLTLGADALRSRSPDLADQLPPARCILIDGAPPHAQVEALLTQYPSPLFVVIAHTGVAHDGSAPRCQVERDVLELGPLPKADYERVVRWWLAQCTPPGRSDLGRKLMASTPWYPGTAERMFDFLVDRRVLTPALGGGFEIDLDRLESTRLPSLVSQRVAARYQTLSVEARRTLQVAASIGSPFWHGALVAALFELRPQDEAPECTMARALDELSHAEYCARSLRPVVAHSIEYAFVDPLDLDYARTRTTPTDRRRVHRATAVWLESQLPTANDGVLCGLRATHLEGAGIKLASGLAYLEAADEARAQYDLAAATNWYERGLAILGDQASRRRIDALHDYGDVLALTAQSDRAERAFRLMGQLARELNLPRKAAAAAERSARLLRNLGQPTAAERHLDRALVGFNAMLDYRGVAAVQDDRGRLACARGEYAQSVQHFEMALRIRREIGDKRSVALSLENLARARLEQAREQEAEELMIAAFALRLEVNDQLGVVECLYDLARLATLRDDHQESLRLLEQAHHKAASLRFACLMPAVLAELGNTRRRLGDVRGAMRLLSESFDASGKSGSLCDGFLAARGLAKAHLTAGDVANAERFGKRAAQLSARIESPACIAIALRTLGEVAARGGFQGRHQAAAPYFMRSIRLFEQLGNEVEMAKGYRAFAHYAASPAYGSNAAIQREACRVGQLAEAIFIRHRRPMRNHSHAS